MHKYSYISIVALLFSIAGSIGFAQASGKSILSHRQALPWGNAEITKTSDGMNIRFALHQQPEHLIIDSSSLSKLVSSYSCFVQVPSGREITLQTQQHSSHRLALNNLSSPVFSALSKLAKNVSTSLVQLQGYRWFRGIRLAQLNISAYTNNAQSVQAIDTVEIDLKYKMLSTYKNLTMNSREDKQFKSIFDALILDADESSNTITEPLNWHDSTGTWLPQNGKAIKLTIPNDGIYRISYLSLVTLLPELSLADPGTFRLFNKGKEIPLNIKTGNTGILEYIEFVGIRNYNGPAYRTIPIGEQEYSEYLNRYTDTSYYWITWGGVQGKRYISNDTTGFSIDTIQWYTEKLHIEQNSSYGYIGGDQVEQQNPFWTSGDIWLWYWFYAGREIDIPFNISQLNTSNPTFRVYIKVANYAADLGVIPVSILKTGVNSYLSSDTTAFSQFEQKIIQKDISISTLSTGNNTLKLFSLPTASSTNSMILDWVDVEYPRNLSTSSDSLWFGFSDLNSTEFTKSCYSRINDHRLYSL